MGICSIVCGSECLLVGLSDKRRRGSYERTRPAVKRRFTRGPAGPRLELPVTVAQHRHAVAGGGDARDLELVRADHEVDVRAARVDARRILLPDEEREAVAERDVGGSVLVEERV